MIVCCLPSLIVDQATIIPTSTLVGPSADELHEFCMRFFPRTTFRVKAVKLNLTFALPSAATLVCAALLFSACTRPNSQPQQAGQNRTLTAPTGASVAVEAEDGQWPMPAKNYAST